MGIYERDLASFEERPLLENTMVPGMCLNCHAFNKTNPDHLSLHIRGKNGGTLMQIDGKREMLDTKTDSTLSAGVPLLASKRQIYCLFCQQYAPVFPCGEG